MQVQKRPSNTVYFVQYGDPGVLHPYTRDAIKRFVLIAPRRDILRSGTTWIGKLYMWILNQVYGSLHSTRSEHEDWTTMCTHHRFQHWEEENIHYHTQVLVFWIRWYAPCHNTKVSLRHRLWELTFPLGVGNILSIDHSVGQNDWHWYILSAIFT